MAAIRLSPRDTSFDQPALAETPFLDFAGSTVYDTLYHFPIGTLGMSKGPMGGIGRLSEQIYEKYYGTGDKIPAEEANKNYGLDGALHFDEPVYESYAQLLYDRKLAEHRREYELASGSSNSVIRRGAGFGISLVSQVLDPVNLAAMFIPVVGESKFLSGVERAGSFLRTGLISPKTVAKIVGTRPTAYRLAKGSLEGLVGTTLIEPFNLIPGLAEQADYSYKDSAFNLFAGTVMGGLLHAGLGKFSDIAGPWLERQFSNVHTGIRALDEMPITRPDRELTPEEISLRKTKIEQEAEHYAQLQENVIRNSMIQTHGFNMVNTPEGKAAIAEYRQRAKEWYIARNPVSSTETHEAAFSAALNDIISDRPVTSASDVVSVHPKLVESDIQEANSRQLFAIAAEVVDRYEQLKLQGRLTPEMETRQKFLRAMLQNPTDATPENLAQMLGLAVNETAKAMPSMYSHVDPNAEHVLGDRADEQTAIQKETLRRIEAIIQKRQNTQPIVDKVPTDEARGLKEPVKTKPEPIENLENIPTEKSELDELNKTTQGEVNDLERELNDQLKAEQKKVIESGNEALAKIQSIKKGLIKWADKVIDEQGKKFNTGVDPRALPAVIIKGAEKLYSGVKDLAQWSKEMAAEFGDWIKPHLKDLFAALHTEEFEGQGISPDVYKEGKAGSKELMEEFKRAWTSRALHKDITEKITEVLNNPDVIEMYNRKADKYINLLKESYAEETAPKEQKPWTLQHKTRASTNSMYHSFSSKEEALAYRDNLIKKAEQEKREVGYTGQSIDLSKIRAEVRPTVEDKMLRERDYYVWAQRMFSGKYINKGLQSEFWAKYPEIGDIAKQLYAPEAKPPKGWASVAGSHSQVNPAVKADRAKDFAAHMLESELGYTAADAHGALDDWNDIRSDVYQESPALGYFIDTQVKGVGGEFKDLQYLEARLSESSVKKLDELHDNMYAEGLDYILDMISDPEIKTYEDLSQKEGVGDLGQVIDWLHDTAPGVGKEFEGRLKKAEEKIISKHIPGEIFTKMMKEISDQIQISHADHEISKVKEITPGIQAGVECMLRKML